MKSMNFVDIDITVELDISLEEFQLIVDKYHVISSFRGRSDVIMTFRDGIFNFKRKLKLGAKDYISSFTYGKLYGFFEKLAEMKQPINGHIFVGTDLIFVNYIGKVYKPMGSFITPLEIYDYLKCDRVLLLMHDNINSVTLRNALNEDDFKNLSRQTAIARLQANNDLEFLIITPNHLIHSQFTSGGGRQIRVVPLPGTGVY
ncbi:hypothetical protein HNP86_002008 [Methanococcus maripaludis]|uniref:Uncharacterized protein n=1 Tax=Methanococcus maripaludis TaxID=39152 RepID=A0A7J9NVZ0_METMI|nr:hypothetical protein [Methanococcus maripaludis]MBA2851849.1 hypothetical protein [Methanococcus maripaludis]